MQKKDAIKFRSNTNNRGYGFEQVTEKTVDDHEEPIPDDESQLPNPYHYNFRAEGNKNK